MGIATSFSFIAMLTMFAMFGVGPVELFVVGVVSLGFFGSVVVAFVLLLKASRRR